MSHVFFGVSCIPEPAFLNCFPSCGRISSNTSNGHNYVATSQRVLVELRQRNSETMNKIKNSSGLVVILWRAVARA